MGAKLNGSNNGKIDNKMAARDKGILKCYTGLLAVLVYSLFMGYYKSLIMCIRDRNVEDCFLGSTKVRGNEYCTHGRIEHQSISDNRSMAGFKKNHQIKEGKYSVRKIGEMASLITTMVGENESICKGVYTNRTCGDNCWFGWRKLSIAAVADMQIITSHENLVSVRDIEIQYSIEQSGGWLHVSQGRFTWYQTKDSTLHMNALLYAY